MNADNRDVTPTEHGYLVSPWNNVNIQEKNRWEAVCIKVLVIPQSIHLNFLIPQRTFLFFIYLFFLFCIYVNIYNIYITVFCSLKQRIELETMTSFSLVKISSVLTPQWEVSPQKSQKGSFAKEQLFVLVEQDYLSWDAAQFLKENINLTFLKLLRRITFFSPSISSQWVGCVSRSTTMTPCRSTCSTRQPPLPHTSSGMATWHFFHQLSMSAQVFGNLPAWDSCRGGVVNCTRQKLLLPQITRRKWEPDSAWRPTPSLSRTTNPTTTSNNNSNNNNISFVHICCRRMYRYLPSNQEWSCVSLLHLWILFVPPRIMFCRCLCFDKFIGCCLEKLGIFFDFGPLNLDCDPENCASVSHWGHFHTDTHLVQSPSLVPNACCVKRQSIKDFSLIQIQIVRVWRVGKNYHWAQYYFLLTRTFYVLHFCFTFYASVKKRKRIKELFLHATRKSTLY